MHKLISREIYKSDRGHVCLTSYYDVMKVTGKKNYRIKLAICRDGVYYQSYARSYVWADVGWEFVCFIPVDFLNLEQVSVYFGDLKEAARPLMATEKDLLDRTISIVL